MKKYTYDFPMCSATATVLVVKEQKDPNDKESVKYFGLFGQRWANAEVYPKYYCLPGGFMEVGREDIVTTAIRELGEETFIDLKSGNDFNELTLFHVSSNPNTDNRAHVVNVCFYVGFNHNPKLIAGDDLADLCWIDLDSLYTDDSTVQEMLKKQFAFDHYDIAMKGYKMYKKERGIE